MFLYALNLTKKHIEHCSYFLLQVILDFCSQACDIQHKPDFRIGWDVPNCNSQMIDCGSQPYLIQVVKNEKEPVKNELANIKLWFSTIPDTNSLRFRVKYASPNKQFDLKTSKIGNFWPSFGIKLFLYCQLDTPMFCWTQTGKPSLGSCRHRPLGHHPWSKFM